MQCSCHRHSMWGKHLRKYHLLLFWRFDYLNQICKYHWNFQIVQHRQFRYLTDSRMLKKHLQYLIHTFHLYQFQLLQHEGRPLFLLLRQRQFSCYQVTMINLAEATLIPRNQHLYSL